MHRMRDLFGVVRKSLSMVAIVLVAHVIASASAAHILDDNSSAAIWRATARLGYGVTPALMQAVQKSGGAKPWSLA